MLNIGLVVSVNTKKEYSNNLKIFTKKPLTQVSSQYKYLLDTKIECVKIVEYLGLNKYHNIVWRCRCECGKEFRSTSRNLTRGEVKSCGCRIHRRKSIDTERKNFEKKYNITIDINEYKACKSGFSRYKTSAKKRNIIFEINLFDFVVITRQKCYYCGHPHGNVERISNEFIRKFNGIDRVENSDGYHKTNILPCCKTCNYMKKDMTVFEFADYITRLIQHSPNWIRPLEVRMGDKIYKNPEK